MTAFRFARPAATCLLTSSEKLLPVNLAENLSLPRRWQRLPKSLSDEEIERLLVAPAQETPRGSIASQSSRTS